MNTNHGARDMNSMSEMKVNQFGYEYDYYTNTQIKSQTPHLPYSSIEFKNKIPSVMRKKKVYDRYDSNMKGHLVAKEKLAAHLDMPTPNNKEAKVQS